MADKRTFKWGDRVYLLDDLLALHAAQENNYYNFARDKGKYDDTALQGLRQAVTDRINAVKNGQVFEADGSLPTDVADNVSVKSKNRIFRKDEYTNQDNTAWAKHYLNKLVSSLKEYNPNENSNKWDINKFGLSGYFSGQGLNAQDIFSKYDKRDKNNPDAERSFDERNALLKKQLLEHENWIYDQNFNFTENDNVWDDDYLKTLGDLNNNFDTYAQDGSLPQRLRKLGLNDSYITAFTSNRWDLSKTDEELEKEEENKKKEEEKLKSERVRSWQDEVLKGYQKDKGTYYNVIDYSSHPFKEGVTPSFMNYYSDLNADQRSQYGTDLGITNESWDRAYQQLMESMRNGTPYADKNKEILLQRYFENAPNGFTDLGDGTYLINDSVGNTGYAYRYDPKSGFTQRIHISEYANQSPNIKKAYEEIIYKNLNKEYGTDYNTRTYVEFKEGGILKAQLGSAILSPYNVDDQYKEEAAINGIDAKTQKAKNQYMDSKNKSDANPNAGWDAKHYARLGSAVADLGAAVAGFVPGYGTIASAALGIGSTITNFFTDMSDDAVTTGEMWRNLGLNLGMDVMGLIPGGGAASKMGKIIKTLKGTVPLIIALPGVASLLKNSPEIAKSWKRAFDGGAEDGGEKMTYQDYMNILQVLNVAAGVTNISRNTYKSAKKAPKQQDKIAVEVFVKDKNGKPTNQKKALVFEGDDVEKFKDANEKGEAQKFIDKIEGMDKFVISEITTSNKGKFWGRDQNDKFHVFNQNPFGQTSTGRAKVLTLRQGPKTNIWGIPIKNAKGKTPTTLYAETGRWDADLGYNKGELVYTKGKNDLDTWIKQQQTDVNDLITSYRQKAEKYKERTDKAIKLRDAVDADINTNKTKKSDIDAQIAAQQKIIDDSGAEATRIQDWLDAGGVNTAKKTIKNARAEINRLEKSKEGKSSTERKEINNEIKNLKKKVLDAKELLEKNTPKAVLAAQDKVNTAVNEQSKLQIETSKLQALLDNLNHRRTGLNTRATKHSNEYDLIKNFKGVKKTFNGKEYTFDVNDPNLKNLDGLFKQGGSINRNKLNKFLNYGKR